MAANKRNDVGFNDRRQNRRIPVSRTGRMVGPFSDVPCRFEEVSVGGARVHASCAPEVGDEVAIELPRVGYARGTVVRMDDDTITIAFDRSNPARNLIAQRLDRLEA